ncbi:hypothetical protein Hanom_Chr13g01238561 [Helianthus anomalus]
MLVDELGFIPIRELDRKKKELVPDHKQKHKIEVKHPYDCLCAARIRTHLDHP